MRVRVRYVESQNILISWSRIIKYVRMRRRRGTCSEKYGILNITSLLKLKENNEALTYSIEAILGIFIIVGAVIYTTGNMPPMAHKVGQLSKVQLMNIGRDTLDLMVITPEYETSRKTAEKYILTADKTFVNMGDTVNFTVYYANSDSTKVMHPLYFSGTTLIISNTSNISAYINEYPPPSQNY